MLDSPVGGESGYTTPGWVVIWEDDATNPIASWTENDIAEFVRRSDSRNPEGGMGENAYYSTILAMSPAQSAIFYRLRDLNHERAGLGSTRIARGGLVTPFEDWLYGLSDADFALWNRHSSAPAYNDSLRRQTIARRGLRGGGDDQGGEGGDAGQAATEITELYDDFVPTDATDTRISANGWVSVQLEPIYRNYELGRYGLTWQSLDLFPAGPSSVGNSPNLTINGMPSALGNSLDLYPRGPSSVSTMPSLYGNGPSSVGNAPYSWDALCGR